MKGLSVRYIALCGVLSLCSMWQYGYVLSYVNTAEDAFRHFLNDSQGGALTNTDFGWTWSALLNVYFVGILIGTFAVSFVAERWGRRCALGVGSLTNVAGTALSAAAVPLLAPWLLGLGRLVVGGGSGLTISGVTLLIQETAAVEVRGLASTLISVSVPLVATLATLLGFPSLLGQNLVWLIGLAVVPEVIQLLLLPFIPDTPKFLFAEKQLESDAAYAVKFYQGPAADCADVFRQIREELACEAKGGVGLRQLLSVPHLRLGTLIGCAVFLALQFTGIVGIFYYSSTFFVGVGLSPAAARWGTTGLMALNALCTAASMLLVEKVGRRPLLLWNEAGIVLCLVAYVVFATLYESSKAVWLGWACLASIALYVVFFSFGPGSVAWYITAELVPQEARSLALSVAQFVNNAASLVLGFALLPAFQAMGPYAFLPFFVLPSLVVVGFLWRALPETQDREVADVVRHLSAKARPQVHPERSLRVHSGF